MLRRLLTICIVLVMVLSFSMACTEPQEEEEEEEPTIVLIGGSTIGGSYYSIAAALMQIYNKYVPEVEATAIETGGSKVSIAMMDTGEILMGLSPAFTARDAYTGGGDFDHPHNVRIFSPTYQAWTVWLTLDPNIKTPSDFEGKRIALGDPGTGSVDQSLIALESLGFTENDYEGILVGEQTAADALIDGTVDVWRVDADPGKASVVYITSAKDTYFIPWTEDQLQAYVDLFEAKGKGTQYLRTVPAGIWQGLDEDYLTVAPATGCILVYSEADEDLVYTLVKAMWDNIGELEETYAAFKAFDPNRLAEQDYGIPIHPGAQKYYEEIGVL